MTLLVLSAAYYSHGTTGSVNFVRYDWEHSFLSNLLVANPLSRVDNPARPFAIPAWVIFCASIGALFKIIAGGVGSRFHQKAIEIGGIGSATYASLVFTPMHDLLLGIALLFFVPAVLAALHLLYVERRMRLFASGIASLTILLVSAVMYYGNVFYGALPLAQKLSLASCSAWLLALHYAGFQTQRDGDAESDSSLQPPTGASG